MTTEKLYYLIEHPYLIDEEDLNEIGEELENKVASHALQMLYLRGLYNTSPNEFKASLQKLSLYGGNRTVLLSFITKNQKPGDKLAEEKRSENTIPAKEQPQESEIKTTGKLRERHEDIGRNISDMLDNQLLVAKDYFQDEQLTLSASMDLEKEYGALTDEEQNELSSKIPNHKISFSITDNDPNNKSELLEIENSAEIEEKKESETTHNKNIKDQDTTTPDQSIKPEKDHKPDTEKQFQLIDKFLELKPRIVPKEDDGNPIQDISVDSIKENEEIYTESMAIILTNQKLYNKAIKVYKKLSLNYPEKSAYFANQIQKVKKLIH